MKSTKKSSGRRPKAATKTTYERVGGALASTTSLAAGLAREAGERIRDLASSVSASVVEGTGATPLLVHQHREVEALFDRLESSKHDLDGTLRTLADALAAHMDIEEKLFYPAVRKANSDVILEGLEEHAMGRFALKRLLGTSATDESLKSRLHALKELMTNHHKEEERELFPEVRRVVSNEVLEKLGRSMKKLFDADVKRGHEAVLATFADEIKRPVRAKSSKRPTSGGGAKAKKSGKQA